MISILLGANLARAREQEAALLTELYEEVRELDVELTRHRFLRCPVPINVHLATDPDDCEPYLDLSAAPEGERCFAEIEITIGPGDQPYLLQLREPNLPAHRLPPCDLTSAIQHIADWAAVQQEGVPDA